MKKVNEIRKVLKEQVTTAEKNSVILKDLGYELDFIDYLIFDTDKKGKKHFSKLLKGVLDRFDYSEINFDNFDFDSIDFTNLSGIVINPQNLKFKKIYNCKLSGIKFIGSFDNICIEKSDFTGSIGAKINPKKVLGRSLFGCILSDVEFIYDSYDSDYEYFNGVDVRFASFKNSKGAIINPFRLHNRSLYATECGNVMFLSIFNFGDNDVRYTNFKGSTGAKIDPQKVYKKSFKGTILEDAEIVGSFKGIKIKDWQFNSGVKPKEQEILSEAKYNEDDFKIKIAKFTNRNSV